MILSRVIPGAAGSWCGLGWCFRVAAGWVLTAVGLTPQFSLCGAATPLEA